MNIGIIIPHQGASQIAFTAISEIRRLIVNKYPYDITLFFEQLNMPILEVPCASMCINELMSFKGIIITTTIDNSIMSIARNMNSKNRIIFYMWDLEWMRPGKNNYLYNLQAFNVNKLVARSQAHAQAIENYSNRKVDLVSDFKIEEIIK